MTTIGNCERREHAGKGRLAGAVGPKQAEHRSATNFEVDPVKRLSAAPGSPYCFAGRFPSGGDRLPARNGGDPLEERTGLEANEDLARFAE